MDHTSLQATQHKKKLKALQFNPIINYETQCAIGYALDCIEQLDRLLEDNESKQNITQFIQEPNSSKEEHELLADLLEVLDGSKTSLKSNEEINETISQIKEMVDIFKQLNEMLKDMDNEE